jgi:transcriptional regulator with PAS, ATPase and Fis domain
MDDVTRTGSRSVPELDSRLLRWKLRTLYTPAAGVIAEDFLCLDEGAPVIIGRRGDKEAAGVRLRLDDDRASRDHAEVLLSRGAVTVCDRDSKNGTEVNGVRLRPQTPQPLLPGDVLRVGDSLLILRHEDVLPADATVPELVGVSAVVRGLRSALVRWAPTAQPVLLLGDTGTGKGATAAALHRLSGRRGKLVTVNCAAIPLTLAEGLLFGTTRGAFTGAVERTGFFGEAHQGTLFLDEIGDLPQELQPKLLHALESGQVIPVGASQPVRWDVRIVAATNQDLDRAMAARTFRQDLYARLSAAVLSLVPLRERREDVLLLCRHLLGKTFHPSPRLADALVRYGWPHNVREVGNVVSQLQAVGEAEVLARLGALSKKSAPAPASDPPPAAAPSAAAAPARSRPWKSGDPPPTQAEVIELLRRYRGSLRRIETEIGYSRRQFRRWTEQYGLDLDRYRSAADED